MQLLLLLLRMRLAVCVCLFAVCSPAFAGPDSLFSQLYRKAQVVAEIQLASAPWDSVPAMVDDLGTTWFMPAFSVTRWYKRSLQNDYARFSFVWKGYNSVDTAYMKPGGNYLVFLMCNSFSENDQPKPDCDCDISHCGLQLMQHGIYAPNVANRKALTIVMNKGQGKAVRAADWKKVEQKIKQTVNHHQEAFKETQGYFTYHRQVAAVVQKLRQQNGFDSVIEERCTIHIDIYPGWTTLGVRFTTAAGPVEKCIHLQEGRVLRYGWLRYKLGLATHRNRLYFRKMYDCPGFIRQQQLNCESMKQ